MIRKWYFCVSESSLGREQHGWEELIRAAVRSARTTTSLRPILVYDGQDNDFTKQLEADGVTIVRHRVSFYDALQKREAINPGYLAIASGAFLRVEIPVIETEDEYVLYTDCDVNFLKDPDLTKLRPRYFACAPQTSTTDYVNDLNTGVMVMNVAQLRADLPDFTSFIVDNLYSGWPGCDQENYRRYYRGKWDRLPLELNWKPYWGTNGDAVILHWHGPKPLAVKEKFRFPSAVLPRDWQILIDHNPAAYRAFLDLISPWEAEPAGDGIAPHASDIMGNIDGVSDGYLYGWVLRRSDPANPAQFNVSSGEDIQLEVVGLNLRPDLKSMYQTEVGGFRVRLPSPLTTAPETTLRFQDAYGKPVSLGYLGKKREALPLRGGRPARNPNEPVHISPSPMMPPASSAYFVEAMRQATCYLEYGTGGTTLTAAKLEVPHVICVESDADWLRAVKTNVGDKHSSFYFIHADVGETRELGFPVSDQEWRRYHNYPLSPWEHAKQKGLNPDLVLVDGRFRVACFLTSLLMAQPGTRIFFDDYVDREYYQLVEKYTRPIKMIDRVAEFICPKMLDRDAIWTGLFSAVTDAR